MGKGDAEVAGVRVFEGRGQGLWEENQAPLPSPQGH